MKKIDLHVHSLVSDGSFLPRELAAHAKAQGLAAFALTDHDVIAGNDEAQAAAAASVAIRVEMILCIATDLLYNLLGILPSVVHLYRYLEVMN